MGPAAPAARRAGRRPRPGRGVATRHPHRRGVRAVAARSRPRAAARLRAALERFGHERFRPGQREALEALLAGRDALVVLPTGFGKSLIFQAAADVLDGPVVVVCPLIVPMADQVEALEETGVGAARIDGGRGERARRRELERFVSGEARLAYLTPEQLEEGGLAERLAAARPALVAVDEAHTVSRWGRGLRPAFLGLGDAAERLGRPPAARKTARWLRERGVAADHYHGRRRARDRERVQAGFDSGAVRVVVATNAFGLGVDVPDVRFVVHRHNPADLEAYYQEAGRAGRDGRDARCTLVYRPDALAQAAFVASTGGVGREDLRALAAALGDCRERGLRDLGRASGVPAGRLRRAVELLETAGGVRRRRGRVRADGPIDADAVPLDDEERREAYEDGQRREMRAYAETDGCRRAFILNHFGEPFEAPCGRCDNDRRPGRGEEETPAPAGAGVGARVRHPAFGAGAVQRVADGAITVQLDDGGLRTPDAGLVVDERLLAPAASGAGSSTAGTAPDTRPAGRRG